MAEASASKKQSDEVRSDMSILKMDPQEPRIRRLNPRQLGGLGNGLPAPLDAGSTSDVEGLPSASWVEG